MLTHGKHTSAYLLFNGWEWYKKWPGESKTKHTHTHSTQNKKDNNEKWAGEEKK